MLTQHKFTSNSGFMIVMESTKYTRVSHQALFHTRLGIELPVMAMVSWVLVKILTMANKISWRVLLGF